MGPMFVRVMGPSIYQGNGANCMSGYMDQVYVSVIGPSVYQDNRAKCMSG